MTYRFSFDASTLSGPQFEEFRNGLNGFGVALQDSSQFTMSSEEPTPLSAMLEEEHTGTLSHLQTTQGTSSASDLAFDLVHLAFPIRY